MEIGDLLYNGITKVCTTHGLMYGVIKASSVIIYAKQKHLGYEKVVLCSQTTFFFYIGVGKKGLVTLH